MNASPLVARSAVAAANMTSALLRLPAYVRAWREYERLNGGASLRLRDADPRLLDRVSRSPFDAHYVHQAIWAAERIFSDPPSEHVDVGSQLLFVGMLSTKVPVTFVDIRPPELRVAHFVPLEGDIVDLPFPDRTVASLSCLHVVEHVGLGRYGDTLNPRGSREALLELKRVLMPDGRLFLSLPVGKPRVCFNAHRVHDPHHVVNALDGLELIEFSAVNDAGAFVPNASLSETADSTYACGLFLFRRPV